MTFGHYKIYNKTMKHILILLSSLTMLAGTPTKDASEKPSKPQVNKPQVDKPKFPRHWGHPPKIQVRDHVKLPGKFGFGSSTLAKWISNNLKSDTEKGRPHPKPQPKPPVKPVPPIVPVPPVEVKEKMNAYKEAQQSLQASLQNQIKQLGKKPTKEEVRKVVEKFRANNKDLIESQKELGKTINDWHKENKPERPSRPEPTEEMKQKLQQVREKQKDLDVVKKEFHEKLKNSKELSKEQKTELIKDFKESNADKHKAVKNAQKELQKEIRQTKQTGDRRQ